MRWATRKHCHVDRAACAWLIRRFVDDEPQFVFVDDPVLWEIARIVHEADLADERYDAPEASGLDALLRGLSLTNDDERMLELTAPLFDGLYEFKKRALLLGREPS